MPKRAARVPAYRHYKLRNLACVTINGKTIYLGTFGSQESKEKYARLIAEHAASPVKSAPSVAGNSITPVTVTTLAAAYHRHATAYYVKNGRPTGQVGNIVSALRALRALYASAPAASIRCLELEAVRASLLAEGKLTRSGINRRINLIRQAFRWAESKGLVPPGTWHHLQTLEPLKKHRSRARETPKVKPVKNGTVEATLPHLPAVVADMVRFQRLTGCRPTEVCLVRPGDVDKSGAAWIYSPCEHKGEHHERTRRILIGPKAQAVLAPYMLRDPEAFCFSPQESERSRRHDLRARRVSKVPQSQRDRRKSKPKRKAGERYDHHAYNRAIRRAIDRANAAAVKALEEELRRAPTLDEAAKVSVPRWHANQLRHATATEVRRLFGVEGAQLVLGHSEVGVTQVYAERDFQRAEQIAIKIG